MGALRAFSFIVLLLAGSGCSRQDAAMRMTIHDECRIRITGLSLAQAKTLVKEWRNVGCDVEIGTSADSSQEIDVNVDVGRDRG